MLILLIASIALVFWASRRAIRLPDGTEIISVSADFGTNHYFSIRESRRLGFLGPLLPGGFGRLFSRQRRELGIQSTEEMLVITLTTTAPDTSMRPSRFARPATLQAQLVDEHGCIFPSSGTAMRGTGIEHSYQFRFHQFPRREAKLELAVTSSASSNETAHLSVVNPLPLKPDAHWKADAVPASRTVGDLTFTLEDVRAISGDRRRLQLKQNGSLSDQWALADFEIEDSQGNRGPPHCKYESVCRVRAIAWPTSKASFASSNAFLIADVKLPPAGSIVDFRTSFVLGGLQLRLVAVAAPGVYSISNKMVVASSPLPPNSAHGYTFKGYVNVNGKRVHTGEATWTRYRLLFEPFSLPGGLKLLFRTRSEGDSRSQPGFALWAAPENVQEGEEVNVWRCFNLDVAPDSRLVQIEAILVEPRVAEFYVESAALTNFATFRMRFQ